MPDPSRPTVLVVDDDEPKRYAVARTLRGAGFGTVEAETGADALRLAGTADLIVLDVKLPDIDGYEVCRRLKANPVTASIPVLHLSATYVGADSQVRGLEMGADAYLTDASEPPVLVATIRALLRVRRAEADRRATEEQFRTLVESVWDYAIFRTDPAGRAITWNMGVRRVLGFAEAEFVGLDMAVLFTPEDRAAGVPEWELREAAEHGSASDDRWMVKKDGTRFFASGTTNVVRDEAGRPVGYTKVMRDQTEWKRTEDALRAAREDLERQVEARTAELRESQRRALSAERLAAIGQTVAGLAHEGGNALQRCQTYLDRLRWRLTGRPDALDLLAEAQRAQDDLRRLYEDVRGYAAPVALECRPGDLAGVWRAAWADVLPLHPGAEARLVEDAGGLDRTCELDPFRLKQVFRNVFDNALAAAGGPATVLVGCRPADLGGRPAVRVAVRDDGPGLTPEQRDRMFEPFYTTKARGTGLGLAIARRVVEAHGGQIEAGDAAGAGTEIVITLPRRTP